MIHSIMKEGKLVPSDVTVRLLQQAMQGIDNDKFLIDGFPRNEENVKTFENLVSLLFNCFKWMSVLSSTPILLI